MQDKKRQITSNTMYTIAGALVLNGVLQLIVYPRLNARMGTAEIGIVLYIMAFVNILGPSIGQAMNNSRLVLRRDLDVTNGDYNLAILLFGGAGMIISLIMMSGSLIGNGESMHLGIVLPFILSGVLILATIYRYYGDVEYRLSLKYRNYFLYYLICSIGYLAGYLLYLATGNWFLIFLLGECAALVYVYAGGHIFRPLADRSALFPTVLQRGAVLTLSYFVTNLTLNIDRLYLNHTLGSESVTIYYVVSLIGKTLVLFVAPINTIIISYLTKNKQKTGRRQFMKLAGAGLIVSAVFWLLCQIGTPIFIRLFYPDLAAASAPLVTVVNLTQILAMLSAYLFIIVLTFTSERWQLGLQIAHLVILMILITIMTPGGGLYGFSVAVLIANAIRIAAVLVLGMMRAGQD